MKRRDFIKSALSISAAGILGTNIEKQKEIEIKVNIYKTEKFDEKTSEEQMEMVKNYLGVCLRSLETEEIGVNPDIKIIDETIEKEYTSNELYKWFIHNYTSMRSTECNILLTDDTSGDGKSFITCVKCYSAAVYEAGYVKHLKPEYGFPWKTRKAHEPYMDLVIIAHEVGHSLGFDHFDADVKRNGNEVISTLMLGENKDRIWKYNYLEERTKIKDKNLKFIPEYNKDIEYLLKHQLNIDSAYNDISGK